MILGWIGVRVSEQEGKQSGGMCVIRCIYSREEFAAPFSLAGHMCLNECRCLSLVFLSLSLSVCALRRCKIALTGNSGHGYVHFGYYLHFSHRKKKGWLWFQPLYCAHVSVSPGNYSINFLVHKQPLALIIIVVCKPAVVEVAGIQQLLCVRWTIKATNKSKPANENKT